jgi:hypothetical protein
MAKKVLTIMGATGIQGGSVISALIGQSTWSLRAVTRDPSKEEAKKLASQGIEVVQADSNDVESLKRAFAGTHAIYALTNYFEAVPVEGIERSMDIETQQGKNLADAAAATESLEHYVWSTLPNSKENTGGEAVCPYFESKNRVDAYIRTLPDLLRKTTFYWVGWYASNLYYPWNAPCPIPTFDGSKVYVNFLSVSPSTPIPHLGDPKINTGIFAAAILANPEKTLPGKYFNGVLEWRTFGDLLDLYAESLNVKTTPIQVVKEDYVKMWGLWSQLMHSSNRFLEVAGKKSFSREAGDVVEKEDLDVKGLVTAQETFKKTVSL